MECVTRFFQRVPQTNGSWLWQGPRIISELLVPTHAEAKGLSSSDRGNYARRAAESWNTVTRRGDDGDRWLPMSGGNDKAKKWSAKTYVNITNQDLEVQITGPLGTIDENTKARVSIPPGCCLLSTITGQPGGKQHFARNFISKKTRHEGCSLRWNHRLCAPRIRCFRASSLAGKLGLISERPPNSLHCSDGALARPQRCVLEDARRTFCVLG